MSEATATMEGLGGANDDEALPGLVLLCAKDPENVPQGVALRATSVIVGREPPRGGCTIAQTAVSRQHARLFRNGTTWHIEDLGSRNGTYLDGRRIEREALHHRAAIRIGDTLFAFLDREIEHYLPYCLDGSITELAVGTRSPVPELVGGLQMDRVARHIERAAATDLGVLILGETGTGKELVARALHRLSGRSGPLVPINSAAIPTTLFESELFGFRKGAFSGADRDKLGLLQSAHLGTVFFDEIGDMPFEAQAKLLRVLEAREVAPLGAVRAEPLDVRFVCATNRDLRALIDEGRFRDDLYARIAAVDIGLPPLRDRKEDLYRLTLHFLRRDGRPDLAPSFPFMLGLCDYDFPQNVRECEAVVRRAIAMADGPSLEVRHLPPSLRERVETYGSRSPSPPGTSGSEPQRARARLPDSERLRALLVAHEGNVAAVARELGKDRAQVHRLIRRYDLVPDDFRRKPG